MRREAGTPEASGIRFLLHPGAGSGRAVRILAKLRSANPLLRERSDVVIVRGVPEAVRAIGEGGEGTLAVAAGGDGTANLVAQALLQAAVPGSVLGVVPLGTGNAFAHSLGVARLDVALNTLVAGSAHRIDVMRTSHPRLPLALVSLSMGFEASFIRHYTRWRRGGRPLAGAMAAAAAAWSSQAARIDLDGEPFVERGFPVHNAGLYNLPCYAAGRVMWPDADGEDGWAEAVACRGRREYWGILRQGLPTAAPRLRGDPVARRWRSAEISVDGPIQVDGETAAGWTGSAWVEERILPVLLPPVTPGSGLMGPGHPGPTGGAGR